MKISLEAPAELSVNQLDKEALKVYLTRFIADFKDLSLKFTHVCGYITIVT